MTKTSLFHYHLPEEFIAQFSVEPRDHSRLMVVDRQTGAFEHKKFFEIINEFHSGDVLVFNDTKVFRARLKGVTIAKSGKPVEVELFLLRAIRENVWEVLIRPARKVPIGSIIVLDKHISGEVIEKGTDGTILMKFDQSADEMIEFANQFGDIPVPPYVKNQPQHLEDYQTVYARQTGSVAAPTAGFHFTQRLLDELKQKGVQCEFVTLHVGIGTFRPMKSETLEEHEMHSEFVTITEQTADQINRAKQEGRRVMAVGTTTVRTLEGVAKKFNGRLQAYMGDVNLFIKPGFEFCVIDGLVTNFHLPQSTLLVLVSAFAGREPILAAYQEAVHQSYRFFSFGDAMFIR